MKPIAVQPSLAALILLSPAVVAAAGMTPHEAALYEAAKGEGKVTRKRS